jgi:excisionase family DNA binding protein
MSIDLKLALTAQEAAVATGVSEKTITRAIKSGRLRAKRSSVDANGNPAGRYLILVAELQAWLDSLEAA